MAPIFNTESVTFIERPLQNDCFSRLAHDLTGDRIVTEKLTDETTSFISSLFRMIAKCNISFSAASSRPFKEFVSNLVYLCNPTANANILLSKLHPKTLARMIIRISKDRIKKLLNTIQNRIRTGA